MDFKNKVAAKYKLWLEVCLQAKKNNMRILLLMLVMTSGLFAQEQIYNVQQYCIDNKPFTSQGCDIQGNEYSFVFVDETKNEVVLFLSDTKISYQIVEQSKPKASEAGGYKLKSSQGLVDMRIDATKSTIEFVNPERRITLKVGKSTKASR